MIRPILSFLLVIMLGACNNDSPSTSILQAAPYAALTDSIQEAPKNADLYFRRAGLLLQNDEKDLAEADIRTAWRLKPKEEIALRFANILRHKSEDSATVFLQQASKTLPQSIVVQVGLARGYQKRGKIAEALAICNEVISRHPNQLDALLLKAELLEAQNKGSEALKALETAYSYAPFDLELVHNLAFAYAEAKNPKALSLTDSLLRMDTSGRHAEPYYFKALYHENTGNTAQAISLLDEAVRRDYYFLDAHMEKGQILYRQKEYAAALKAFQLAATITPTFADAYYWVGRCLEAKGNKGDAKLNYQRAYELDKSMKEAKTAMDRL